MGFHTGTIKFGTGAADVTATLVHQIFIDPDYAFWGDFSSRWGGLSPDGGRIAWWQFDPVEGPYTGAITYYITDVTVPFTQPQPLANTPWIPAGGVGSRSYFGLLQNWVLDNGLIVLMDSPFVPPVSNAYLHDIQTTALEATYPVHSVASGGPFGVGDSLQIYRAYDGVSQGNWDPFTGVHRWGDCWSGASIELNPDGSTNRADFVDPTFGGDGSWRYRIGPAADDGKFWAVYGPGASAGPYVAPSLTGAMAPVAVAGATLGAGSYIACTTANDGAIYVDNAGIAWHIADDLVTVTNLGAIPNMPTPGSWYQMRTQASPAPGTCYIAACYIDGDDMRVDVTEVVTTL